MFDDGGFEERLGLESPLEDMLLLETADAGLGVVVRLPIPKLVVLSSWSTGVSRLREGGLAVCCRGRLGRRRRRC